MSDDKKIISFTDAKRQKEYEEGQFQNMDTEMPEPLKSQIQNGNEFVERLHNKLNEMLGEFMNNEPELRQPAEIVEAIGRLAISVLTSMDVHIADNVLESRTALRQNLGYHAIDFINQNAMQYAQSEKQPVFQHDILIGAFIAAITGAYEQRVQIAAIHLDKEEPSNEKRQSDDQEGDE